MGNVAFENEITALLVIDPYNDSFPKAASCGIGRGMLQKQPVDLFLYLAITIVVHELLSFGRSRFAAMRISSVGRSPRMIGQ